VPNGDDVPLADEDADLAGLDGVALVDVPEGSQYDDQPVAELLHLRPLVRLQRVLDRELVQAEQVLDPAHLGVRGLVQTDPAEAPAVVVDGLGNGLGVPGQILPFPFGIHPAVHDHTTHHVTWGRDWWSIAYCAALGAVHRRAGVKASMWFHRGL